MDEFQINEDTSSYTPAEIADLITAGNAALDALLAVEEPTPAQADEAERINADLARLAAETESRSAAATRLAAIRESRIEASTSTPESDEDSEDDEDEATADSDEADEDADEDDEDNTESDEDEDNPEGDAVTASTGNRSARRALARSTSRPTPEPEQREKTYSLVAAADVPGFSTGSELPDIDALVAAVSARMRGLPSQPAGIEGGTMQRFGVAQIKRDLDFWASADPNETLAVVAAAGNESRLEGGSLTAAGGWCAPSQINYDLCADETTDGLIDVPEMGVTRGGVQYTSGPDFTSLYNATGFQTEAQAIAGTTKTCYTVTCPDFDEVRLDAVYLCLKFGFLQNTAYPELTRNVTQRALIAQQHRVSADVIQRMVGLSGTPLVMGNIGSTASNTLNALELVIETQRGIHRLSMNQTLEVVAPHWLRAAIRADLGMRNGVDMLAVTDQQIVAHFASRGARVQWVYNWQMLANDVVEYPANVDVLAYPAGTFVKGTTDVITLDAVYDAASLSQNEFTGLFTEEGILVLKNCLPSKIIRIPVCSAGRTGAANNVDCYSATA